MSTIFSKIINKEINADIVYEDDTCIAFKDINPAAKIHVLAVPKTPCVNISDFVLKNDNEIVSDFFRKIEMVIDKMGIKNSGYRIISNSGIDGGQEVPHFHIHILGGQKVGPQ